MGDIKMLKTKILFVAMLALSAAGQAQARGRVHKKDRVEMCHRGNTITVSIKSAGKHLRHGDPIGACAPCDPPIDADGRTVICKGDETKQVKPGKACREVSKGKAEFGACGDSGDSDSSDSDDDSDYDAPADTDGDGVTDDIDVCPGTPAGDSVYADGCTVITLSADAGSDMAASQGDVLNTVGQGSVLTGDYPDADLVYEWAQTGGDAANFWFSSPPLGVDTAGTAGDLTFTLTVSTADGSVSATDSFTVSVACSATIVSVDPPNGEAATYAMAVNDAGQVAAWCGKADAPFVWDDGASTGMGTLGGAYGVPRDITESGEVSLLSKIASGQNHAVIWSAGTLYDMQLPGQCGGCNGDMLDTNEAGVSGGWSEWTSPIHSLQATLWHPDGTYEFVTPDGYRNGLVQAVGESGDILLAVSDGDPYKLGSTSDGLLMAADGTLTDLGKVGAHPYLRPFAMSAAGIVGWGSGSGPKSGFLWTGGVLTDLGSFVPLDINASGDIVGADGGVAILMRGGAAIDLNTLLPDGSGWTLTSARAINANGRVVGTGTFGGVTRGFVMDVCD